VLIRILAAGDKESAPSLTISDVIIGCMREGELDMFISNNIPTERS
jgi:hypothetical protein